MVVDAKCRVLPCGEKDISISTAITPNGDGFNESFDIQGIDLCGFVAEIKIFNRWGERVFESEDITVSWNGKVNNTGIECPSGTYFYIINYTFEFGVENEGKGPIEGTVDLIR